MINKIIHIFLEYVFEFITKVIGGIFVILILGWFVSGFGLALLGEGALGTAYCISGWVVLIICFFVKIYNEAKNKFGN